MDDSHPTANGLRDVHGHQPEHSQSSKKQTMLAEKLEAEYDTQSYFPFPGVSQNRWKRYTKVKRFFVPVLSPRIQHKQSLAINSQCHLLQDPLIHLNQAMVAEVVPLEAVLQLFLELYLQFIENSQNNNCIRFQFRS